MPARRALKRPIARACSLGPDWAGGLGEGTLYLGRIRERHGRFNEASRIFLSRPTAKETHPVFVLRCLRGQDGLLKQPLALQCRRAVHFPLKPPRIQLQRKYYPAGVATAAGRLPLHRLSCYGSAGVTRQHAKDDLRFRAANIGRAPTRAECHGPPRRSHSAALILSARVTEPEPAVPASGVCGQPSAVQKWKNNRSFSLLKTDHKTHKTTPTSSGTDNVKEKPDEKTGQKDVKSVKMGKKLPSFSGPAADTGRRLLEPALWRYREPGRDGHQQLVFYHPVDLASHDLAQLVIPGAQRNGVQCLLLTWTGNGQTLQASDALGVAANWTAVAPAAAGTSYTVVQAEQGTRKFYRLQF